MILKLVVYISTYHIYVVILNVVYLLNNTGKIKYVPKAHLKIFYEIHFYVFQYRRFSNYN